MEAFTSGNYLIFAVGEITALLTAFYMFRLCFKVFFGPEKGHGHESPANMTWPLMILGFLAVTAGLVNTPLFNNWFGRFVSSPLAHHAEPSLLVIAISSFMALTGIFLAYQIYYLKNFNMQKLINIFPRTYTFLKNKYYFDEIYDWLIVKPVVGISLLFGYFDLGFIDGIVNGVSKITVLTSNFSGKFDLSVIDGLVNGISGTFKMLGNGFRRIQTGYIQNYALFMIISIVLLVIFFAFKGG